MTTTERGPAQWQVGDQLPTEQLRVRNTSSVSENKIHEDSIAREYGFRGGLVPGATTYAYLASYLARTLGRPWVERGTASISLVRPVYDGDEIVIGGVVTAREGDAERGMIAIECWVDGDDGERRAPASASVRWGEPAAAAEPLPEFALTNQTPRPSEARAPITVATAPVGETLPPVIASAEPAAVARYLDDIDAHDPRFRGGADGEPIIHPGWYTSIANRALSQNFLLGPWMHTRSEIQHLSAGRLGGDYTGYSTLVAAFEKRGHEYASVDVLIVDAELKPVARVLHTAIVVTARRGA